MFRGAVAFFDAKRFLATTSFITEKARVWRPPGNAISRTPHPTVPPYIA
jgi:hypothetical protein